MKHLILCMLAATMLAGCSTTPIQGEAKYTFESSHVSVSDDVYQKLTFNFDEAYRFHVKNSANISESLELSPHDTGMPIPMLTQQQVDKIISHPDSLVDEFPIVQARLGETVINDQTKTELMAVDADVINGKVVYEKEPTKFGKEVSVTVKEVDNNVVTYKIYLMKRDFIGFDTHETKEGLQVEFPFFEGVEADTELIQKTNSWLVLGGLVNQQGNGEKMHSFIIIRVLNSRENT